MSEVRFGNYRVVEALGSGALATIYKAVQEPLGRVVALKALKTQISPTSSFGEQLDREAKILKDLAHPNVVLLLDVARTPAGRPFLVLELVEGPSVQQLLDKPGASDRTPRRRPLAVESALAIAIGVCQALEHVHERGVVHRDVKPSNILVGQGGVVKLIDFGIAQRARVTTASDAFGAEGVTPSGRLAPEVVKDAFGTPAYMSPEQILGDFVDGRSDLFSLGVVLYQMLSGTRPFEAAAPGKDARGLAVPPPAGGAARAAQRIRRDVPVKLGERAPHVSRTLERLVMRLLEKSPSERYATASEVLERLVRELRALTRNDPATTARLALVETGFLPRERRAATADGARAVVPRRALSPLRVLAGQGAVLVLFLGGVLAVEGGVARGAGEPGNRRLELAPENAGGLRVQASPWADVQVDGQKVETTPFAHAVPLAPGKHWVTLTHPDAPPVEREIDVTAGETVTLDVTMALGGAAEDAGKGALR
ncbi:MAG: Serine/threonine-protein kinase PknB [Labilithrix sp.]|nr:Serine/threonine-protein kinase PknB [Labilithrix sp.]